MTTPLEFVIARHNQSSNQDGNILTPKTTFLPLIIVRHNQPSNPEGYIQVYKGKD